MLLQAAPSNDFAALLSTLEQRLKSTAYLVRTVAAAPMHPPPPPPP
eukprot:SAG31_NODE_13327_length_876_cov_1.642214_2_plen_45_part_01